MTDPNDFDRLHPQTAPTQQPTQPITPTMPAQPQGPQQSPDHRRKRPAWVMPTIIAAIAAVVVVALILVFTNLNKPAATDNATAGTSSAESSAPAHSPDVAADDSADDDGNTSTQAPADASIESLAAITNTIESDMQASVKSIKDKLAETEGKLGDTYDSYKNNMGALDDWYTYLEEESHRLYVKIGDSTVKYWQTLSALAQDNKYLDADALSEDYYDAVYDGTLDDWYDEIYDGILDDVYDKYYDGVLDDALDTVPYAEVSDVRSDTYKALSNARSDFYSDLSDMRGDVYGMYTDIRSEIYGDDYDFTKVIERYQKKFAKFEQGQ